MGSIKKHLKTLSLSIFYKFITCHLDFTINMSRKCFI